jgi:hypothetical protein
MKTPALDLDAIYDQVKPWDFRLKVDGAERAARRLSNVDLERLRRFGQMSYDEAVGVIEGLFEDADRPDVRRWDESKVVLVVSAVVAHYRELFKKKAERLVQEMARRMEAQTTAAAGGSTAPAN